jgi:hypothetical protein
VTTERTQTTSKRMQIKSKKKKNAVQPPECRSISLQRRTTTMVIKATVCKHRNAQNSGICQGQGRRRHERSGHRDFNPTSGVKQLPEPAIQKQLYKTKWTEQRTQPFLETKLPIRFYFQYQKKNTVLHYDSKHLYSAGRKIKCITTVLKFRYPEYTERKGICSIYNF